MKTGRNGICVGIRWNVAFSTSYTCSMSGTRARVMLLQFLLDIPHEQQAIAIRRFELLEETGCPLFGLLDIGREVTITDGADFYRIGIVLERHIPIVFELMIPKDRDAGIRRTGFITACVGWRTRVEGNPHDGRNVVCNLLERIAGGKKHIPTLCHGGTPTHRGGTTRNHPQGGVSDPGGLG